MRFIIEVAQLDKYEYNLKLSQMKELLLQGKNEEAAAIADTINWNKIRNINDLVKAGEVYEKVGRFEDSREILLNAYERSPIGRTIIYRLAEVAIKMEDFDGAMEYYNEFVDIAPHDNQRYILSYNMKKAQKASYEELIPILEEFKEQEYTEEWTFELAELYHKAEKKDKCVEACDELILWFGDGLYVEKALELKMKYEPLTKLQEEKYKQFQHEKEGKTVISVAEMEKAGEYVEEPVVIPQVMINSNLYNTTNLQEEIVKGMKEIMETTDTKDTEDSMDEIKKIVEEIPYLKSAEAPKEDIKSDNQKEKSVVEEVSVQQELVQTETEDVTNSKVNFQEFIGEEKDGQMSLVMKEKAQLERQITGQIKISDILQEWESTKLAVEKALQEVKAPHADSEKEKVLQEAEDIMTRLNDILPKIQNLKSKEEFVSCAGVAPKKEEQSLPLECDKTLEKLEQEIVLSKQEDLSIQETSDIEIAEERQLLYGGFGDIKETPTEVFTKQSDLQEAVIEKESSSQEVKLTSASVQIDEIPLIQTQQEVSDTKKEENVSQEEVMTETPIIESVLVQNVMKDLSNDISKELEEGNKIERSNQVIHQELGEDIYHSILPEPEYKFHLTTEQKAIFSYFIPVKGMELQLCRALSGIIENLNGVPNSSTANLIIQGCEGCGKTVLATSMIKVLQAETGRLNGRIGKINATALNKKDIRQILKKVAGGCIIIEKAGELDRTTAVTLSLLLEQEKSGTLVILEDTAAGIKKVLLTDDRFAKKFTEVVKVPIFSNEELIVFANSYANELGYVIDEMAVLALHNRISNIEKLDQATTLVEVKDIIDEAIEREANSGLRKAFNILTAKRYTDDDQIVLTEKDFQ